MSRDPALLVWETEQVSLMGRGRNWSRVRQEREGKKHGACLVGTGRVNSRPCLDQAGAISRLPESGHRGTGAQRSQISQEKPEIWICT